MAVKTSVKVQLITHHSQERELFDFLQKSEVLEVVGATGERSDVASEASHIWGNIESALQFLEPFASAPKKIKNLFVGKKVLGTFEKAEHLAKGFPLEETLQAIKNLEIEKHEAESQLAKLEEEETLLREWKTISLKSQFQSKKFSITFARFPRIQENVIESDMQILPEMVHLEVIEKTDLSVLGIFVYENEYKDAVQGFISGHEGEEISFTQYSESPQKEYERVISEKRQWNERLTKALQDIHHFAKRINDLKLLSDYYFWEKSKEEALLKGKQMNALSFYEGWVLEKDFDGLQKKIEAEFPETQIEKIHPSEGEVAPIRLVNTKTFRPFEIITRIFGLPASTEFDPSPYLAPFFVIFFGLCLTDAGYGILLSCATFFALRYLHLEQGMKEMMTLLFWGGISTIILGALFGGWFGIDVKLLPPFLQQLQIFDPFKHLESRVGPLIFGIGFFHLWLGTLLSGITKVKNGNTSEALQTSFPLVIALIAGPLWGMSAALGLPGLALFSKYVFFGMGVVLLWGFGYGTKNPIIRIIKGVLGILNEVLGWLGNVLSYSRLFALGIATGIIGLVFNQVAMTIGGLLPSGINLVAIILIVLFGHTLNIALNLLGAFIHSGRLQFVEFFGRFIEGGGVEIKPLRRIPQHIFLSA